VKGVTLSAFDGKALPRSGDEKSLDSQFKIVAEAFLELFELLEEYAPIWYTEEHHQRALTAWRILQANPSHALGSERHRASQHCREIARDESLSSNGRPRPALTMQD